MSLEPFGIKIASYKGMSMVESLMSQDWEPFIRSMVNKVQTPQLNFQNKKIQAVQAQSSELSTFENHLMDLQALLRKIGDGQGLNERTIITPQKNDCATISASPGTRIGDYEVEVLSLATPSKLIGAQQLCTSLGDTSFNFSCFSGLKEGFFTVNGHAIEVSSTDTLQSVFDRLSAIGITASYDAENDKIKFNAAEAIYLGAANDTSNLLSLLRLYSQGANEVQSLTRLNRLNQDKPIATEPFKTPITTDGCFSINGVEIAYKTTDSVNAIMANINRSKAGVYIHYSANTQSFFIQNKETGSLGISIADVEGQLMSSWGLTSDKALIKIGQQSSFTLNGGETIVSNSNTFSSEQHEILGLTIQAEQLGSVRFSVKEDNESGQTELQNFVTKYNEIYDYLIEKTKADPKNHQIGVFNNSSEIKAFIRNFKGAMFSFDDNGSGPSSFIKLSQLGLKFDENHHLFLNKDVFKTKLQADPDGVKEILMSTSSSSPIRKGLEFLSHFMEANCKALKDSYHKQQASIQRKINQLKRQFELQESGWRKTFDKITQMNAQMLPQMQAINGLSKF